MKVRMVVTGLDLILIAAAVYQGLCQSPWYFSAIPVVVAGMFINPRWSKYGGWRFKHD